MRLHPLENTLLRPPAEHWAAHRFRFAVEFLYFGIKEARACLFAGLFFVAIFATPRAGIVGIPRYDVLLAAFEEKRSLDKMYGEPADTKLEG